MKGIAKCTCVATAARQAGYLLDKDWTTPVTLTCVSCGYNRAVQEGRLKVRSVPDKRELGGHIHEILGLI